MEWWHTVSVVQLNKVLLQFGHFVMTYQNLLIVKWVKWREKKCNLLLYAFGVTNKSGKVSEFQSGQGKVREMSEETVLGLPHEANFVVPIFFLLASLAYYLYSHFSIGGSTLGWNQLLGLAGGLLPSLPAGVSLNVRLAYWKKVEILCALESGHPKSTYILGDSLNVTRIKGRGVEVRNKKRAPLHVSWPSLASPLVKSWRRHCLLICCIHFGCWNFGKRHWLCCIIPNASQRGHRHSHNQLRNGISIC